MIKNCEQCRENFNAKRSAVRFCGSECAIEFRKPIYKVTICEKEDCNNDVIHKPGYSGKFCSRSCAASVNNKKSPKLQPQGNCFTCDKVISKSKKFCSPECETLNKRPAPIYNEFGKRLKQCKTCDELFLLNAYHFDRDSYDGRQSSCKQCNINRVKQWQSQNIDQYEKYWRNRDADVEARKNADFKKRAKKYGLSTDELKILLQSSNGVCQICKKEPHRWLVVDHCHNSLEVRGILCEACNQALGLFKDNILSLKNAIEYLEKQGGVL